MSSGAGRGGCGGRGLQLLLLLDLVLAFAAVEYMLGSILETGTGSPRAYLYTPPGADTTRPHHPHAPPAPPTQLSIPKPDKLGYLRLRPKRSQSRPTSSDSPGPDRDYQLGSPSNLPNNILNSTAKQNQSAMRTGNERGVSEVPNVLLVLLNKIRESAKLSDDDKTSKTVLLVLLNKIRESAKLNGSDDDKTRKTEARVKLKPCPVTPPDLGPIPVNKTEFSLETVENLFPEVQLGGRYAPPDCRARHKVALIVPFRDRNQHLAIFLNHMHPLLMKQQLDYGIFVVEQKGDRAFNRAKLMNVGYAEAQKARPGGWDCFVFHDIDLLPLDSRNIYSCPRQPRHMSKAIDKYNFSLPYAEIFGGVSAMTVAQFEAVNGFSNKYWGWGGEDDDMFYRIKKKNLHVVRYPMSIARYTMLDHMPQSANPKRFQLLSQTNKVFTKDGLSSLGYQVVRATRHRLYTYVLANIDEHSWWVYIAKLLFGNDR